MKVKILILTDEASEARDYRQKLAIKVDGKTEIEVYDGEPEDNNLSRNFAGCYKIGALLGQAYRAGYNKESFSLTEEELAEF